MNRQFVPAIIVALAATPSLAQQQPQCPDYSLVLAQGVQAFTQRDAFINRSQQLDAQVTDLKKQLSDAQAKIKADDELLAKMRGEAPHTEAKPESGVGK
jgi:hypothetical protein